ncbi:MAG: hypothetical protein ACTSV6_06520 [Candidatus Heimdallarchaeota archaeon]
MTWNGAYIFDNILSSTYGIQTTLYLPAAPVFLIGLMKSWYALGVASILLLDVFVFLKYRNAVRLRFLALLLTVVATVPGLILESGAGHLTALGFAGMLLSPFVTFLILTRPRLIS